MAKVEICTSRCCDILIDEVLFHYSHEIGDRKRQSCITTGKANLNFLKTKRTIFYLRFLSEVNFVWLWQTFAVGIQFLIHFAILKACCTKVPSYFSSPGCCCIIHQTSVFVFLSGSRARGLCRGSPGLLCANMSPTRLVTSRERIDVRPPPPDSREAISGLHLSNTFLTNLGFFAHYFWANL